MSQQETKPERTKEQIEADVKLAREMPIEPSYRSIT